MKCGSAISSPRWAKTPFKRFRVGLDWSLIQLFTYRCLSESLLEDCLKYGSAAIYNVCCLFISSHDVIMTSDRRRRIDVDMTSL